MAESRTAEHGATLRAYGQLLAAQVRSQAQYRLSFVLDMVAVAVGGVLDVLTFLVFFRVTPALGGFSVAEVFVMVGLSQCAFALADLLVGNIERLRHYVRTGLLDTVLIRPLGALPQLLIIDFAPRRVGRAVQGLLVLAVAVTAADVVWTPARIAIVVVAPLAGAVFFSAIFVAGATVAFWWIESGEMANAFTYGGKDFTSSPITIYSGWFRRMFAYGLGFAFVAYYPALALLGRPDPLGASDAMPWASPLVAVVAASVAGLIWRTGVRHYRSTGS